MQTQLFKKSKSGKTQTWTIELDANMYRTTEGYVDGAKTTTAWTVCEGKSVGKANATSPSDQAAKEVEAKIKKQKDKGWTTDIENIEAAALKVLPMLALNSDDYLEELIASGEVLAAQPKLDGIRGLGEADGTLISKSGKAHNPAVPHISEAVKQLLDGVESRCKFIDGEFYNHKFRVDFNSICSIIKTKYPSEEQLEASKQVMQYHVYDLNMPGSFAARYAALRLLIEQENNPIFQLVETVFIDPKTMNVKEELDRLHKKWVSEGYEGSMIRRANSPYKSSRVKDLLKRKDFVDQEFELIEVLEGKGNKAGMAASVLCKNEAGETFSAGIIGDEWYCKQLWDRPPRGHKVMVTIKYQNLTPDRKVPRFAKMKAIRDYE